MYFPRYEISTLLVFQLETLQGTTYKIYVDAVPKTSIISLALIQDLDSINNGDKNIGEIPKM